MQSEMLYMLILFVYSEGTEEHLSTILTAMVLSQHNL